MIISDPTGGWNAAGGTLLIEFTPNAFEVFMHNALYVPKAIAAPVPEPATLMLLSTGLVGLVGYRWRQGRREGQQIG